jgi:hypothetical protein
MKVKKKMKAPATFPPSGTAAKTPGTGVSGNVFGEKLTLRP